MSQSSNWVSVVDVDGWRLRIFVTPDYSLITDFELASPSGDRFSGTVGTPEMVRQLIDRDGPDSDPFWMSDLILISELSETSIISAVTALISRGEVAQALVHVGVHPDEAGERESHD